MVDLAGNTILLGTAANMRTCDTHALLRTNKMTKISSQCRHACVNLLLNWSEEKDCYDDLRHRATNTNHLPQKLIERPWWCDYPLPYNKPVWKMVQRKEITTTFPLRSRLPRNCSAFSIPRRMPTLSANHSLTETNLPAGRNQSINPVVVPPIVPVEMQPHRNHTPMMSKFDFSARESGKMISPAFSALLQIRAILTLLVQLSSFHFLSRQPSRKPPSDGSSSVSSWPPCWGPSSPAWARAAGPRASQSEERSGDKLSSRNTTSDSAATAQHSKKSARTSNGSHNSRRAKRI